MERINPTWFEIIFLILLGFGLSMCPDWLFKSVIVFALLMINWRISTIQNAMVNKKFEQALTEGKE